MGVNHQHGGKGMASDIMNQAAALFNGQDPVFWAATAAVAAGLTILIVTAFLYLRRFRVNRARRQTPRPIAAAPARPATGNPAVVQAGVSSSDPAPDRALLLARLKETAAGLEALRDELRARRLPAANSRLKNPLPEVEYIFRQGVG